MCHLIGRLVKTSWQSGLKIEHVEEAIKLLNGSDFSLTRLF
jgi:hypothetical protein